MGNIADRDDYNAQRGAIHTFEDLDYFHQQVVQRHNNLCGDMMDLTRREYVQHLVETGSMCWRKLSPAALEFVKFRLHPQEIRQAQRTGIHLHGLKYRADELVPLIIQGAKVEVYWDDDDITVAHTIHPDTGEVIRLRARLPQRLQGPLNIHELKEYKQRVAKAKRAALDSQSTLQQIAEDMTAKRDARLLEAQKLQKQAKKDAIKSSGVVLGTVSDPVKVNVGVIESAKIVPIADPPRRWGI